MSKKRCGWDVGMIGYKNNNTYMSYFIYLTNLLLSRYKWINLPDTMNERFLELSLYEDGRAILVNDEVYGKINLRCAEAGKLNIYQEALSYEGFSFDFNKIYELKDIALVKNNATMTPDWLVVKECAERLYEIRRTLDVNTKALKTPVVVSCPENQKLTAKNMYMKFDGNEPVIFTYKDEYDKIKLDVAKLDVPCYGSQLFELFNNTLNEFLTRYGINNANTDKKERQIVDEVNSNNQMIHTSADIGLMFRQEACEKYNKLYGTDIWCELRNPIKEGDESVEIYDGTPIPY